MTLSTLTSRVTYPGTGSVGPFVFPFRILSPGDLLVTKLSAAGIETTLVLTTHYAVAGVLDAAGTVTLVTALAAGETLVIRRKPALTQPTSIRNQGAYFPGTIEDEFDRLVMQLQSLQDELNRSFRLRESADASAFDMVLSDFTAGKVVTGTGTGLTMSTLDSSAVALPGNGRTVPTLSAYLANNAVANLLDYGAVLDGVADDTVAMKLAITSLPSGGGRVLLRKPGSVAKLRLTSHLSTEINSKNCFILVGDNARGHEGANGNPYPAQSIVYLKDLTTYMYTKAGTTNDIFQIEGVMFDGGNGGASGTTCPGIAYSNGIYQLGFTFRRVMWRNFGYAHTNVAGSRAMIDIKPVFALIDECWFAQAPNGRHLYIDDGSTHTTIRQTEFNTARECYYIRKAENIEFDRCVFESCTTIGAQYFSQVTHKNCWYENIGFNQGTAHTSGIAQRNHGLTYAAGALNPNTAIITPLQQLFGSFRIENGRLQTFATGGSNFTAAAWMECLGQPDGGAITRGGSLYVSGMKQFDRQLFSSTMALTAAERDPLFHVHVEDSWSSEAGSTGASLFIGSGHKDYRKCNIGFGRIVTSDGNTQLAQFRGGRLVFDIQDYVNAYTGAPAVWPLGDQWEIGDKVIPPVPVAGGSIGRVCTTAGTPGTWKTFGAIQA